MFVDLVNSLKFSRAFASAQVTGDANSSLVIDTQGYQGMVAFVFLIAAVAAADGSNYCTIKVEESDSDSFATGNVMVTDTAERIVGTQVVINATSMANSTAKFGVTIGTKRYMRLVFDETGTFDGTFGAIAVLGGARNAPVA